MPKYPEITVDVIGYENAFDILARVRSALAKSKKVNAMAIDEFMKDAMSGDYDHLLQVVAEWVNVPYYSDKDNIEICLCCGEEYLHCICDEKEYFDDDEYLIKKLLDAE